MLVQYWIDAATGLWRRPAEGATRRNIGGLKGSPRHTPEREHQGDLGREIRQAVALEEGIYPISARPSV